MESEAARIENRRSLNELADKITELAGHLNAANHRFLQLLAEFDRRKGWSDSATQSCAHWLNWKCGIAMGAAREKVRVAHALEQLPKLSASMARGELSYSKVREITRVACPATEDYFVMIALHGTAQHVERLVRGYRRAAEAAELTREAQQQANRRVTFCYDADGSLILKARLPAETGALLLKALDAAIDDLPIPQVQKDVIQKFQNVPAGTSEDIPSRGALRADALGALAESFLSHGAEQINGGDRHQIVVHVAAETLRDNAPGQCEMQDGPSLPAETARRLACDASVVMLLENDDGQPLNVGRKTRSIPPAVQRALNSRDQGCRFPGCCNRKFVDAHHVHHWAHGGETKLSNLVTLCRFHHRKVHEGGVVIEVLDDGAFRFTRPDGKSFDSIAAGHTQPLVDWTALPKHHERDHIHVDKSTAVTRWRGERMDYGLAVEGLLGRVERGRAMRVEGG